MLGGALRGLTTWTAYALLEFVLASLAPLLLRSESIFTPLDWKLTAVLFGFCMLAGLVLGALGGIVVQAAEVGAENSGSFLQAAATLTLVVCFGVNLLAQFPLKLAGWIALAVTVLLLIAVSRSRRRPSLAANPWVASALLLLPPFFAGDVLKNRSSFTRVLAAALIMLLIAGAAVSWRRFLGLFRAPPTAFDLRQSALAIALVALVCGVAAVSNRGLNASIPPVALLPGNSGRPNVVLVTLDTVQAGHLALYGYHRNTTPHLAELCKQATLYKRAIATSDMTLPSHASLFTGLYAREHGAYTVPPDRGRPLSDKFVTLAEVLEAKGYATMAVAANRFYLQPEFGMAQGFRIFDSRMPVLLFNSDRKYLLRQGIRSFLDLFMSTYEYDLRTRTAGEINQDVFPLLAQAKRNHTPFFLFLNYMDTHSPYIPPAPYDRLFPGKDPKLIFDRYQKMESEILGMRRNITAHERAHLNSQYDGALAYLDFELDRVVSRLKELGLFENTLLVILGDHGEAFGDRHLIEHTVSVYQDQVHVPLIIKYPHQQQGAVVNALVSQIDVMPTVLDVLGYQMPRSTRGRSLQHLQENAPREVIAESYPSNLFMDWEPKRFSRTERAIYSGEMKFITSTTGKRELYNLATDPQEQHNLYNPDEKASQSLRTDLDDWVHTVKALEAPPKLDQRALDRLHSLGYVQ